MAAGEREERKVVSVLFVDLVDFTAASDDADPEDVRARLRSYHARVKAEIERFGGTVEKFVGDAVMAVFGAPFAHEDDAERAVRAGLAVLDGLDVELRAAVTTGEALVTLGARPEAGEGIVAGDVVNTAARLQAAAPPGGLLAAEQTYRATRRAIEYEEQAPVTVKGKAAAVPVWLARGARSRFGVDVEPERASPFVGRDDDLAIVRSAWSKVLREASVQLVTITGEPGVGKTRLVTEFRRFLDDGPELAFWRQGRCLPYGEGITFWALGEIVKAHAGILESDSPDDAARKLDDAIAGAAADERDWLRDRLAPLVGVEAAHAAADAQDESFAAWRTFLELVAAERPLVVLLEDLHWADAALRAFVDHLVDWTSGVPLLVLCTARPELYEHAPGWGGGKRNAATVNLGPLTGEETARLVAALLERTVLPAETQALLLERAGGNPLYAEEFVRMLTDRGLLGERGHLAADHIPVPETVQALIAARLDTLPPDRKSLVQDAAVMGKVFWTGSLVAMADRHEREVRDGLHELSRKELVRPARVSSVEGQAEHAFWHVLVRDVAYGQIPRAERARKHVAAAQWIEAIAGDRGADHAELLVHHYGTALELAHATGLHEERAPVEDALRRALASAAVRAAALDVTKAETFYERALELTPPDEPGRARLLADLAAARMALGRLREAQTGFEEALSAFQEQGDRLAAGGVLTRLSRVRWLAGDSAGGTALCEQAVALLEREPPGAELAAACAMMTAHIGLAGRFADAIPWADRTLDLAERLGHHEAASRVLSVRGFSRFNLGDLPGGIADLERSLSVALEHGLGAMAGTAYSNLAEDVWLSEGPARAVAIYRAGIEFCERRGQANDSAWAKMQLCWALYDAGEWDELLHVADDVVQWDRAKGPSPLGPMALANRVSVLAKRGLAAEAAGIVQGLLAHARALAGNPQVLPPALLAAALAEHAAGRHATVRALLEELDSASAGRPWPRGFIAPEATRLALAAGARELAGRLLEGADDSRATRGLHAVVSAQALLAEHDGATVDALQLYADAAARWAEFGFPLERAHALAGQARCLAAVGRVDEAHARLGNAQQLFRRLGVAEPQLVREAASGGTP